MNHRSCNAREHARTDRRKAGGLFLITLRQFLLQLSSFDEDVADEPKEGKENHVARSSAFTKPLTDFALRSVGELAPIAGDVPRDLPLSLEPVRVGDRVDDPEEEIAFAASRSPDIRRRKRAFR
jgi:hypothetical protein